MRISALALLALTTTAWAANPPIFVDTEKLLYQMTNVQDGLFNLVSTCSNNLGAGRSTAAEWLRTLFHDASDYNTATKTGGVDGSIQFQEELSRPENAGAAIPTAINQFKNFVSPGVTMADLIALGAIQAIRVCGGPKVLFRPGRPDALGPGTLSPPNPNDNVTTHGQLFSRMGFSQQDMIALIACGHTIGFVHGIDQPEIIANGTNVSLDKTPYAFDNAVAYEYVNNIPQNPLTTGPTLPRSSDANIFNLDNKVTVTNFANNPSAFQSSCLDVLQRLADLVSPDVTLLDPLIPPGSVGITSRQVAYTNGSINLITNVVAYNLVDYPNKVVTLLYNDTTGTTHSSVLSLQPKVLTATFTSTETYSVTLPIDPASGIVSIAARVDIGNQTYMGDNNGTWYAVDANSMVNTDLTCSVLLPPINGMQANGVNGTLLAKVLSPSQSVQIPVYINNGVPHPPLNATPITLTPAAPQGYQFYSFNISENGRGFPIFNITINSNTGAQLDLNTNAGPGFVGLSYSYCIIGSSSPVATPTTTAKSSAARSWALTGTVIAVLAWAAAAAF
ncbi:heme peroxidase [Polychytrium aggregatum]|uniref:heme peroxidase n=1 Tax=Polychytrium aggregatum TaxID=110093 RepID=UPI0022FF1C2A|nr:heme peroxidase [Polychytrium aggregatum]KAI9208368.1 heme peroxidase [Polychytrium aggregatum]